MYHSNSNVTSICIINNNSYLQIIQDNDHTIQAQNTAKV